jgi:acyl phosphate:glycerol-3-phosphate acyltransferase
MQDLLLGLLSILVAFLLGSTPTALLMGRMKGVDIRQHGSGNIGATNALRVLGRRWGITCLVIDIIKGAVPAAMPMAELFTLPGSIDLWQWILGLSAIAGHMFSPWVGFRGGKGVATSLGVMLAIVTIPMTVAFLVGATVIWLWGYVSLGSVIGAVLLPLLIALEPLVRHDWASLRANPWGLYPWFSLGLTTVLATMIVWKHRGNIQRLREGTERRIHGAAPPEPASDRPVVEGELVEPGDER